MSWRWLAILVLISAAAVTPAHADRKTVTRDVSAGNIVIATNYVQGNNWRWQSQVLLPGPGVNRSLATIVNGDRGTHYVLDLNAKKYIEPRRIEPILTLAMWLRRAPRITPSGKIVHTYFESIDTGESRKMLGHTARHIIMRERTVAEPGACSGNLTIEKDGWYIPSSARGEVRYTTYLGGARECSDTVVVHGTRPELGFALQEKLTVTSDVPSGYPVRSHASTREVLEFSEQPLDKSFFVPPQDFVRADVLPGDQPVNWTQRFAGNWHELERSFESWF